jgi:partner of Y14 and mago protein
MAAQPTASGIVTDEAGERHIPESRRADGSTRKAIKIRPGYRPPEDVEVYKNRTAETFRNRGKGPVPGAEGLTKDDSNKAAAASASQSSAAANKNAKRREARKKAKAAEDEQGGAGTAAKEAKEEEEEADPEAEREKRARTLKKKLRQAKELKEKKETGGALLPEQIAKVIKINELIRELDALGFDAEGEPKAEGAATETTTEASS